MQFYLLQGDFFGELHRMLADIPEVEELHPVPDAYVPVMKFKLNGVSIDLLYAKLEHWSIPEVNSFNLFYLVSLYSIGLGA